MARPPACLLLTVVCHFLSCACQASANADKKKEPAPGTSAMSVELSESRSLSDAVPLTFDTITYDPNKLFTPMLGTFTCPDDDVYVFYWTIQATRGRVGGMLVKEGKDVKYGPLTAEIPGDQSGATSMAAVVPCTAKARVWLRAVTWPDHLSCNSLKDYSSLTAFKIFEKGEKDASAFTAQMSENSTASGYLVFDEELADVGEDYDPSTGQFTVPDDGVYVFTLSVHLANSASNSVRVRKNGVNVLYVLYVVNSYSSSTDSGTTTTTLLVDCQQGDVISVYESTAYRYVARATSFTGFRLLNPDPSKEELVSFHAALGGANTDIVNHYAIVFDVAYVNVGNFYNPEFGIFICPDNATYFFSWSITLAAESHKRAGQAQLVLSDHVKKVGPQTGRVLTGAYSSTASTQTVLRCIKSKAVAIQAVVPGQNHLTLYYHTTNFVGFRLPPI